MFALAVRRKREMFAWMVAFYAECWPRWLRKREGLTLWAISICELAAGKVPN